jgi:hypothetical protein
VVFDKWASWLLLRLHLTTNDIRWVVKRRTIGRHIWNESFIAGRKESKETVSFVSPFDIF